MNQLRFLLCLFITVLLSSCNQGGSTSINDGGGSAGMWTIPGVGTVFTYAIIEPDSTGLPSADTFQFVVTATGQQFAGKSNVVRVTTTVAGQPSSDGDYSIESNGDISLDDSVAPGDITWTRYPTGSKQTITDRPTDTTSFGERTITTDAQSFIGPENLTTAAGKFSTLHVQEVTTTIEIDTEAGFNDPNDTSIDIQDYWFAPSIGIFVKETDSQTDNGQPDGFNFEADLIKYSPK
jgi:hypothetical protein